MTLAAHHQSLMGMVDSNHRRHSRQSYSLPPLATRKIPYIQFLEKAVIGAGRRTQTPGLLITKSVRSIKNGHFGPFFAFSLQIEIGEDSLFPLFPCGFSACRSVFFRRPPMAANFSTIAEASNPPKLRCHTYKMRTPFHLPCMTAIWMKRRPAGSSRLAF